LVEDKTQQIPLSVLPYVQIFFNPTSEFWLLERRNTVITDPAGTHYLSSGPDGAAGASGEVYKLIQQTTGKEYADPNFFDGDVKQLGVGGALARTYNSTVTGVENLNVIHVVGPNARVPDQKENFDSLLKEAYINLFSEFFRLGSKDGLKNKQLEYLRVVPISAGIFRDEDMPRRTAKAVIEALEDVCKKLEILSEGKKISFYFYSGVKELEKYKAEFLKADADAMKVAEAKAATDAKAAAEAKKISDANAAYEA
jgi:hypothetical protein